MIELVKSLLYKSSFIQKKIKEMTYLDYGRDIIAGWVKQFSNETPEHTELNILDVGCGEGKDLCAIKENLGTRKINLFGIDFSKSHVEAVRKDNIQAFCLNIERERFPFPDHFFDFIICNQIIEHTKEIFWIFSEFSRIIKKEGYLIIGVPNLAALHNRIFLLFGDQPTNIHVLGPHVRGFTKKGLQKFIEANGVFKLTDFQGSNLYPMPPFLSKRVVKLFPGLASSIFLLVKRSGVNRDFIEILNTTATETNYYRGK